MESHVPNRKVFVVLSRTHTKIWKDDFEPGAKPEKISHKTVGHENQKTLSKFFGGRNRSQISPKFAEEVAKELVGFERIYLAGGGKGKASAVQNLTSYLKIHHPHIASNIRSIADIDAEDMPDGELLAKARNMVIHDL